MNRDRTSLRGEVPEVRRRRRPETSITTPRRGREDVFLRPGEYFVGDARHPIRSMLGSCVTVTLWCDQPRVAAMSHFLRASRHVGESDIDDVRGLDLGKLDARYGDEALHLMLHELERRSVVALRCKAKSFGGGNMFRARNPQAQDAIGRRNGEVARALLQARGSEVVSESPYGDGHRQIACDVGTRDVWARLLPRGACAYNLRMGETT